MRNQLGSQTQPATESAQNHEICPYPTDRSRVLHVLLVVDKFEDAVVAVIRASAQTGLDARATALARKITDCDLLVSWLN